VDLLLYAGINVTVTLLFGLESYPETLHASSIGPRVEPRRVPAGNIELSAERVPTDLTLDAI
jgi:hypothetical protein